MKNARKTQNLGVWRGFFFSFSLTTHTLSTLKPQCKRIQGVNESWLQDIPQKRCQKCMFVVRVFDENLSVRRM